MEKYIGEVTTVLTNIETGEVKTGVQTNSQLLGMYRNLITTSSATGMGTTSSPFIYISDSTQPMNRWATTIDSTAAAFSVGGAAISGEYWPQYSLDTANNRAIFTFKQRFQPAATTRTINTITLYANSFGAHMAGLNLQTPCIQTSQDILDVFYKIYVYFDPTLTQTNRNVNTPKSISNNLINRWFYASSWPLYQEGTSNLVTSASTQFSNEYIALVPYDCDLNQTVTHYADATQNYNSSTAWFYNSVAPTVTSNLSQGTNLRSLSMATTAYVGTLVNKIGYVKGQYSQANPYVNTFTATPILSPTDSRLQSQYLKSANSADTNFAYLDPSTIGSSTATLNMNDSTWADPQIPTMYKVSITQGGNITNARYKISMRHSFGFASNFFNTERPWTAIDNVFRRISAGDSIAYTTNSYNNRGMNVKRINDKTIVTTGDGGITISNVYTGDFTNYTATSTPALVSSTIQDAVPMPDGSILIPTLDHGLLKLSADRNSITQFTGIGSGVNDNICYAVAVKFNGDFWAMYEGGLVRYTTATSTWTVYNSTSPITFVNSEYNPTWSNTLALYCRKDAGGDEILLSRNNASSLTWWSPSSPAGVNTTAGGNMGINKLTGGLRADMSKLCANLPGTSSWFIPNANGTLSRMTFGTNTATVVSAYSMSSAYYPAVLSPMMYNGSWVMRSFETPTNSTIAYQTRYYNETTLVTSDSTQNTLINLGGSYYLVEVMDDYGACIYMNTSNNVFYHAYLHQPNNPLGALSWKDYGWNSTTSQWEVGNPNGKPVHTTLDALPDGLQCSFTPTGTNDFIVNERWIGYVYDGLHKDNSTTAVLNTATQARNSYTTTNLSGSVVPSTALGVTTENFSTYTLESNRYSWNGGVGSINTSNNTIADSQRSELLLTGDFTFNFNTNQYASIASTTSSLTYAGLYENAAVTPTTKWGFQFRNDGYVVAEDDVARTTRVLPGPNDKFTIKRVGSTITYLVNDVLVFTSAATSANPLRGMFRLPSSDFSRVYFNMKVTYNESRRVLKIGNAVNQTGVYDSRYAMIEAWLTSPRTTKVTIDGVAATILTDPLASPAAGQVLLLQKSGMLVFNTADAGKAVTCEALVLLET